MSGSAGLGSPVEFISLNAESGKFSVNEQALSVLKRISGPVAVVAVCGRARQGKSFLLNQIVRKLKRQQDPPAGFTVSPYHKPCTKGLWLWSEPILLPHAAPDGPTCHLVLMDCEGIDAYDQSHQYSTQIFSLAVLLSSLFVFNQMGGIDEAALERLSVVSELSQVVYRKAGGEGTNAPKDFAPAFLWLLRDFHLQIKDDSHELSPRDYLEEALRLIPGNDPRVQGRNQVRESIRSLFPNRDCFALVRPLNDEEQLARMDAIPPSQFRAPFREGLDRLVGTIIGRAQPKRCMGMAANGLALAGLTQAFVQAINEGAVPAIASAWQYVMRTECQRAVSLAQECYRHSFRQDTAVEEMAFQLEHTRALQEATDLFRSEASVATAEEMVPFLKQLQHAAESHMQAVKRQRFAEAEATVTSLLGTATGTFSTLMHSTDPLQPAQMAQLESSVKEFLARYEASATGPTKYGKLLEFLRESLLPGLKGLVERAAGKAAQSAAQARETAEALAKVEEKANALEVQLQLANQHSMSTEKELNESKLEQSRLQMELSHVSRERDQLRADLAKASAESSAFMQQVEANAQAYGELIKQVSHMQQELMNAQANVARLAAERDQLVESKANLMQDLRTQLTRQQVATSEAQDHVQKLQQELAQTKMEHRQATAKADKTHSDVLDLQRQLSASAEKEREAQCLLASLRAELLQAQEAQASTTIQLTDQLTAVKSQEQEARGELEQTRVELEQTRTDFEQTRMELKQTQAGLEQARVELEQARGAYGKASVELVGAREREDQVGKIVEGLRGELSQAKGAQEKLEVQLAASRVKQVELRRNLEVLRAELNQAKDEGRHTAAKLEASRLGAEESRRMVESLRAELGQAKAAHDCTEAQLAASQKGEEELRRSLKGLQVELEAVKAAQAKSSAELEVTVEREKGVRTIVESLRAELGRARGLQEELSVQVRAGGEKEAELATTVQGLKAELGRAEKVRQELSSQLAVGGEREDMLKSAVEGLKAELVQAKEVQEGLSAQLAASNEREGKLRTTLEGLQAELSQLTDRQELVSMQLATARATENQLETTVEGLRAELSAAKGVQSKTLAELAAARERGDEVRRALQAVQKELEQAKEERGSVAKELAGAKAEAEELQSRLVDEVATGAKLSADVASARAELIQVSTQLTVQQANVDSLQEQLEANEQTLAATLAEKARLTDDIAAQQQITQQAQAELAAAKADLASAMSDLGALQQRVGNAEGVLITLRAEAVAQQAVVSELRLELESREDGLSRAKAERDGLLVRQRMLESQLAVWRNGGGRLSSPVVGVTTGMASGQGVPSDGMGLEVPSGTRASPAPFTSSSPTANFNPSSANSPAANVTPLSSRSPIANISPIAERSPIANISPVAADPEEEAARGAEEADGSPAAPPVPEPSSRAMPRAGRDKRKREDVDDDLDSDILEPQAKRGAPARGTPVMSPASTPTRPQGTSADQTPPSSPYGTPVTHPEKMTVQEIKQWLCVNGYEDSTWELNATKPKKADWVKLIREKAALMGRLA